MEKRLIHFGIALLVAAFISCAQIVSVAAQNLDPLQLRQHATAPEASLQAEINSGPRYVIGSGDELRMTVLGQPDLKEDNIRVRPDGYASFDAIGEVYVKGKGLDEITQILQARLSEWYVEPQINLDISHFRTKLAYLTGAVITPGLFEMVVDRQDVSNFGPEVSRRLDFRLSNIIANAGGVLSIADLSNIEIRHVKSNTIERVNLWDLLKKGDISQDPILSSGDAIYVPFLKGGTMNDQDFATLVRSTIGPKTFPVRVIGQVTTPGLYDITGVSPYLNSAISRAGGYLLRANRKVVAIRRLTDETSFTTIFVDPNKVELTLRPNDIVFVAENKFMRTSRYFEAVSQIFAPFQNSLSALAPLIYLNNNN